MLLLQSYIKQMGSVKNDIRWLCREWKYFSRQSLLNIAVGVAEVSCGLAIVWATKLCVDLATGAEHGTWTLLSAGGILTALMVLEMLLIYLSRWIRAVLGVRAKNAMQERLYQRLLQSDWQALHKHHSGQLMNRIQVDVSSVSDFLSEQLPNLITALVQFVAAFVFLYWMDRRLAIIIAVLSPLLLFAVRFYMYRMRSYRHDQRSQEADIQSLLQETLQQSLVLKTFGYQQKATEQLMSSHLSLRNIIVRNTRYSANAGLLVNTIFTGGYLLAFFWGISQLHAGIITFGAMLAFVQLVGQIQGPVRRLTNYASVFVNIFTASDRLMELEKMPPAVNIKPLGLDEAEQYMPVRMNNVTFTYEGNEQPVLSHWSVEFPTGSVTAVIGHTGSGKTTLISLLLGLLHPQEGEVVTHPALFSYVPQGNTLMSGTVRRNLLLGNAEATEEELWEALRIAQADFVREAPEGLDMPCGERGGGLSEGQAQRICIARAILRHAPILLLDEAFSALDADTAARIFANIRETHSTIIYITHREALIHAADRVVRLAD